MQRIKRLRLKALGIVTLGLMMYAPCFSQSSLPSSLIVPPSVENPAAQDNQTLKNLEIALIRLSAANDTIALLNERLKEKDAVIAALDAKDGVKTEMIDLLKSANKDRATVNNGDARMLEAANAQIVKAEQRIYQLEHPGFFATLFDRRTLSGAGMGYIGCKLTSGSNGPTIPGLNQSAFMFQPSAQDRAMVALRLTK